LHGRLTRIETFYLRRHFFSDQPSVQTIISIIFLISYANKSIEDQIRIDHSQLPAGSTDPIPSRRMVR